MKETGIIMSGNHPKLILDGIKTMTRRVIKPQPFEVSQQSQLIRLREGDPYLRTAEYYCPYGQVGDRLWVRENFFYGGGFYDNRTCNIRYAVDNVEIKYKIPDGYSWDKTCKWCYTKLDGSHPIRPSIFMPRWASRITLEITEVRVERLQEISDSDCQAEGCQYPQWHGSHTSWKGAYKALWDSLNAKRGYGWEVNPWLWVISFKL